jgi:ELWxxDGT repeat protein
MLPNVVLFQGVDSSGHMGLWETDGTAAGTFELTGVAGASSTGLDPVELAPLNADEVLFNGVDKGGMSGLWETDGTAAGTHELTGVAGAETLSPGLYPSDLTVYNGQILFAGTDASHNGGLWVTNGTAAGTHELTVAGAFTLPQGWFGGGLKPSDLTVYNGLVFFRGYDASGGVGLWETDGTGSGTHELTGVAGAATVGQSIDPPGLMPDDLTVYNGQLLFSGNDSNGQTGLWESDGTVSGTHELTGIAGAPTTGKGLNPFDLTVFNGHVLFNGTDSSGQLGLWETDGTAAGTHELTGIPGAQTTGSGLYPSDLTVLNGHVLFGGVDSSGQLGLWETDGTAAGTHELTGIAGAQTKGSGLSPSDLTVLNGQVLFSGVDSAGHTGLWTTDGTAAGTHELTNVGGASTTGLAPFDLTSVATMPVLTAGAALSYVAGATPVALDAGLSVSDTASVNLTAATVTISAGFLAGDALSVGSPQTGIASAYNSARGVLTLSGAASLAAYQKELDSVAFASPHATTSSRTITWSVNDGLNTSNPVGSSVSVSKVVPVVTAGASMSYVAGAAPIALDAGLSVSDAESVNLTAATVTISAGFVAGDALSIGSPQTGIAGAYNAATGVLTLSGAASRAAYQKELDSVAFASPHATASSRTITWSVNDGVNTSAPATSHVSVSCLPPVVTAGASVSYVAGATPVALDAGLSVTDAAAVSLSAATMSISAGFVQGDALSVGSPQTGITSAYNAATGVLTLSGAASLAAYRTELDSVTYASPHATNSSRTITWSVNDGLNTSAPATSHVSVSVPPADPPVPSPDLNIMLQNAGGQLALWQLNGSTLSAAELLGPNPGAAWFERGVGAFFSGDTSDILLQNADGQAAIWEVNGNKLIGGGPVTANPGPSWKAIGTGDFNDDGHSDILFQNVSSGQTSIWEMNGNTLIGGGPVSPIPGRLGKRSEPAISMRTAIPTSCFKTRRAARSRSGKWTGPN